MQAFAWKDFKGFGPARIKALAAREIESPGQLLEQLPTGYRDTTVPMPVAALSDGMQCAFEGWIDGAVHLHRAHGMVWVSAKVRDDSGVLRCMWFNQPWMKQQIHEGQEVMMYAHIVRKKTGLIAMNPTLERERRITPVYAQIPGVPQKLIRDAVAQMLETYDCADDMPISLRERHSLCDRTYALRQAHFPKGRRVARCRQEKARV